MPISNPPPLTLSSLTIDVAKDWGGYGISNLGDINIGANKLKTTDLLIKQGWTGGFSIRDAADTTHKSLALNWIMPYAGFDAQSTISKISAKNEDGAYIIGQARKTGVGVTEIFRMVGAAEPRFKFTLPAQMYRDAGDYGGNFSTYTPPTGVEGDMIVAEDTNVGAPGRRIYVYSGGAWRYVDLT